MARSAALRSSALILLKASSVGFELRRILATHSRPHASIQWLRRRGISCRSHGESESNYFPGVCGAAKKMTRRHRNNGRQLLPGRIASFAIKCAYLPDAIVRCSPPGNGYSPMSATCSNKIGNRILQQTARVDLDRTFAGKAGDLDLSTRHFATEPGGA